MPQQPEERTEKVPIYAYTITLKDGTTRSTRALGYELDGPWIVFDDTVSTVLTIREERVDEIARGEQINAQEVDAL